MLLPLFPKLKGLAWPRKEIIDTSGMTLVKKSASGRRVAISLSPYPIYHIELQYAGLSSSLKGSERLGPGGVQALQALFAQMGGQFGTFRVRRADYTLDPADSAVDGQLLGIGDGANQTFLFTRTLQSDLVPSFTEPVGIVEPLGLNVYLDGTPTSAYTLQWPNVLHMNSAPAAGVKVTADYSWYFMCAFEDDQLELDAFMKHLWSADSVKLVTVKN